MNGQHTSWTTIFPRGEERTRRESTGGKLRWWAWEPRWLQRSLPLFPHKILRRLFNCSSAFPCSSWSSSVLGSFLYFQTTRNAEWTSWAVKKESEKREESSLEHLPKCGKRNVKNGYQPASSSHNFTRCRQKHTLQTVYFPGFWSCCLVLSNLLLLWSVDVVIALVCPASSVPFREKCSRPSAWCFSRLPSFFVCEGQWVQMRVAKRR